MMQRPHTTERSMRSKRVKAVLAGGVVLGVGLSSLVVWALESTLH